MLPYFRFNRIIPKSKYLFQDMYVYVSENKEMKNFDDSELFWTKKGLVYGDWESGPDKDGTHVFSGSIPASQVTTDIM